MKGTSSASWKTWCIVRIFFCILNLMILLDSVDSQKGSCELLAQLWYTFFGTLYRVFSLLETASRTVMVGHQYALEEYVYLLPIFLVQVFYLSS